MSATKALSPIIGNRERVFIYATFQIHAAAGVSPYDVAKELGWQPEDSGSPLIHQARLFSTSFLSAYNENPNADLRFLLGKAFGRLSYEEHVLLGPAGRHDDAKAVMPCSFSGMFDEVKRQITARTARNT